MSVNYATSQIIPKQSDYQATVVSFDIIGDIPIFIMPILEGTNNNINATPFGVSLTYGGVAYPSQLIFVTDVPTFPLPLSPLNNGGLQDLNSQYYYVYAFQKLIDMTNTALLNAGNI